jgi:hypothetical protein
MEIVEICHFMKGGETVKDYKAYHATAFGILVDTLKENRDFSVPDDTKVMIMTHSAVISAELFQLDDPSDSSKQETPSEMVIRMSVQNLHDHVLTNDELQKNSTPIYLKNVSIRPFSNPQSEVKLAFLCLYSDQIVGVTFGSAS